MHIPSTGNQCICAGAGILERCGFLEELPGSCTEGQVSHILSERFSNKSCEGKLDWGIFEKQDPNFDGASGTQILIHKAAQLRNLRLN